MSTTAIAAHSVSITYTEFDLPNGLHVILHADHGTPIVAVSVMYHVGSKDEARDRRGFAHFFEHLLFEGSANIARGEFSRLVERAGGVLNANTNGDRTYYYEVLPANQLELGLWLESERMRHARVDQLGVDTQREVVNEEYHQRYVNQPYGSILPEVLKRAYREHPYQWPTIGVMSDLAACGVADFKAFYDRFYVPDNAVLVVAGDIDPVHARTLVERYFADIPQGGGSERKAVQEPRLESEVRDVVYDRIQLPAVVQAYHMPAIRDPEFHAVDMVNRLLSNGNSSRLNRSLRDEQELAVHVGAFSLPFEDPGLAIHYAVANSGVDAGRLEAAMDAELERVRREGVPVAELDKLKAQVEMETVQANSRVAGVAGNLATAHLLLGDTRLVNTGAEHYLVLSPDDLLRAARAWFDPARRVVLHYLPRTQDA